MLAERFKVTQGGGPLQGEQRACRQPIRGARIRADRAAKSNSRVMRQARSRLFAEKFLRFIIDEVIRHHQQIADQG
jgi:chorismate mutase